MALVGVIIGSIALGVAIMALPTLAQMIWGKPNIDVVFEKYSDRGRQETYLICKIVNIPITNRFLRWLRVYRRIADGVHIYFSIQNAKTGEEIATNIEVSDCAISLPPSNYPEYEFKVVFAKSEFIKCVDSLNGQNRDLPIGEYFALIKIDTPEREIIYHSKFHIVSEHHDLYWG